MCGHCTIEMGIVEEGDVRTKHVLQKRVKKLYEISLLEKRSHDWNWKLSSLMHLM